MYKLLSLLIVFGSACAMEKNIISLDPERPKVISSTIERALVFDKIVKNRKKVPNNPEAVDNFTRYVESEFVGRNAYVTDTSHENALFLLNGLREARVGRREWDQIPKEEQETIKKGTVQEYGVIIQTISRPPDQHRTVLSQPSQ